MYVNPVGVNLLAQAGYGDFGLYLRYSTTSLFQRIKVPKCLPTPSVLPGTGKYEYIPYHTQRARNPERLHTYFIRMQPFRDFRARRNEDYLQM